MAVRLSAIADTEPDGWGRRVILRDRAKSREVARKSGTVRDPAPLRALDFLLAVDDHSRVGALRFCDEQGVPQRTVQVRGAARKAIARRL